MRFALVAASVASALSLAAAAPAPATYHVQLPFGYQTFDIALPDVFHSNDVCPDLKVSCVDKDGKTQGDIGKKPFEWEGIKHGCSQKEPEKNSAECNLRFPDKCLGQCQAQGPLGGH